MHLSFLLGGPCILGAVSKCHQPRAVPRHLPEETAAALHFGSTLGPGKAESALSVPSPSTLPSTYALAYGLIALQFFLVLTPSKLTSFQLSSTTPALRGFSPLLCSPKLLPTNRRSNWSLIKALSGVSRGFGPAGISGLLHREGTRLAVSSSWEGSAPQLRECKQVFLAWTAMF